MDDDRRIVTLMAKCRSCGNPFETGFMRGRLRVEGSPICSDCADHSLVPDPARRPPRRSPNRPHHRPAESA